jgi:hypothetical protein
MSAKRETCLVDLDTGLITDCQRAEAAEAKVARVEANIKSWDSHSATDTERSVVDSFRAALSDDDAEIVRTESAADFLASIQEVGE